MSFVLALLGAARAALRTRTDLALENLALRQQLALLRHRSKLDCAAEIVEAFPDDSAPRYLLRDRDGIYGDEFRRRVKGIGIAEVLAAPARLGRTPFVERVIGTIRREVLDHLIVLYERHLRRRRERARLALTEGLGRRLPVILPAAARRCRIARSSLRRP